MNAVKFAVALKSQVVLPGTTELTKKFPGELVMSSDEAMVMAKVLFDGISVFETELDLDTCRRAFETIFGRKLYFIGFYKKAPKGSLKKNIVTDTLESEGWAFFGTNDPKSSNANIKAVDLTAFLPKK